jgi:hypothetical protein
MRFDHTHDVSIPTAGVGVKGISRLPNYCVNPNPVPASHHKGEVPGKRDVRVLVARFGVG